MIAKDVVLELQARMPVLTDDFSESVVITSIVVAGLTVTVTTSTVHGKDTGNAVNILNVISPVTIASINRVTTVATIVTNEDHDFTLSNREKAKNVDKQVVISAANEVEFNGSFKLLNVINRKTIEVEVDDSGAASATGSPIIENGISPLFGYNGFFIITVLSTTVFTYQLSKILTIDGVVDASSKAVVSHRIARVASLDRAVLAYTKQIINKDFLFVVVGDVVANKDRNTQTDATYTDVGGDFYRQQLNQQCAVYLAQNATDSVSAGRQRDKAEEIAPLIFKAILLQAFATGFTVSERSKLTFVSHGFIETGLEPPVNMHEYIFEQNAELYLCDTVGAEDNVAFRDVAMTFNNQIGGEEFTGSVDLDEVEI